MWKITKTIATIGISLVLMGFTLMFFLVVVFVLWALLF